MNTPGQVAALRSAPARPLLWQRIKLISEEGNKSPLNWMIARVRIEDVKGFPGNSTKAFAHDNVAEGEKDEGRDGSLVSRLKNCSIETILRSIVNSCHELLRTHTFTAIHSSPYLIFLLYNGHLYNRNSWSWRPPKFIRLQGRQAKESADPRNNHPEIVIFTVHGDALWLDACPCGGELLMDNNENLYCSKCKIIYE